MPLISLNSSNLGFLTDTGYIDGKRSLEITRNYTAAFFGRYLKNIPSTLLGANNSACPKVADETRNI
ncbi:MAG TPA: hypothetical protein V6D13_04555 [Halomicronema sp.]